MLRGVVYRLIESLASMGHSSIWKLICAISVCIHWLSVSTYQAPPALVVLDPPLKCAALTLYHYNPTVYIRSNRLFFAVSWVTELFHRSIDMTIDWHYTMGLVSRFPVKNTQALIFMRDDDARTVRLWKETLCNNGENEAWFGNFKLQ